ncbi:MAG: GNAT family N-acetyltransferase [Halioglobus sp.]
MASNNTVYVIDPAEEMSRSLAALLGTYDISVKRFNHVDSFLKSGNGHPVEHSCLLFGLENPGANDFASLNQLRDAYQQMPIIVVVDGAATQAAQQARDAGATDYIEKSLAGAYLFHRLAGLLPGANKLPHTEPSVMDLDNGKQITFRMTHPEDAELQQSFIVGLSEKSRYMRFFSGLSKLPAHVLKEFTSPAFPISYAVVAIVSEGEEERQIGVARWAPTGTEGVAEFAVVVADDCQGQGIASRLMRVLIAAATLGGLERLEGLILKENKPMLAMVKKLGFELSQDHSAGSSIDLYIKHLRRPNIAADKTDS